MCIRDRTKRYVEVAIKRVIVPSFMHMPTAPGVGVGKEGVIGPWDYLNKKPPFAELS